MPEGAPRSDGGERTIPVEPQRQTLVTSSFDQQVLARLPDAAFENLLVVSTGLHPRRIERIVRERGHDPRQVGILPVTGGDVDYDGPLWVADRTSPADLTGLSMRFSEAARHLEPGVGWVCVDSVSTLYMYAAGERVYRFLSQLVSKLDAQSLTGVYCVSRGVLDDQEFARLTDLVDGVV